VELRKSRILAGVMGDGTWFSLFRWLMSASGTFGSLPGVALALADIPLAALATGTRALASTSLEVVGMGAALRPRAPHLLPHRRGTRYDSKDSRNSKKACSIE
jgi:hypothetical protein